MRKHSILMSLCVAAILVAGVGAQAGQVKLGYFCANFNDIFQIYLVDAAKARVAELPNVTLEVMDAQEDVIRQQDQVVTMIQSGVDALIVVPVDSTTGVERIEQAAKEANLPLIYVNRTPYPTGNLPENTYYIGASSILEGRNQMEYLGEKMGGKGNIVILIGALFHEGAVNRTQGNKDVIAEKYPGIKILAEEVAMWQQDQGMTVMENLLTAYGDQINAVVGNNDNMVLGAINAIEAVGRKDIYTIGIDATADALQAILAGRMTATVQQDAGAQGAGSVDMALKVLNGEKIQQHNTLPAPIVDASNAASLLEKHKQ